MNKANIILYGTGCCGRKAFDVLRDKYNVLAWVDRDECKQGLYYYSKPVISMEELVKTFSSDSIEVVVALDDYYNVAKELNDLGLNVKGYYSTITNKVLPWENITWEIIKKRNPLRLYAGDLNEGMLDNYPDIVCLSITRNNFYSILQDITERFPLDNNSVDSFQSEDVAEHIDEKLQVFVLNEIYRVLKPGATFRWSLPDYGCSYLQERSFCNDKGETVFDPIGGGKYIGGKVEDGGHVWFPTYKKVKSIIDQSDFSKYRFYRYFTEFDGWYSKEIDFSIGYIYRIKEHDFRGIDTSIVVDCLK